MPYCRHCASGVPVVTHRHRQVRGEEAFSLMVRAWRSQRLHSADRVAHAALRQATPDTAFLPYFFAQLQSLPRGNRLRRRGARCPDAGMRTRGISDSRSTNSMVRPRRGVALFNLGRHASYAMLGVAAGGAIGRKTVPSHRRCRSSSGEGRVMKASRDRPRSASPAG